MRIGLLGDVHSEDARVEAALGLFAREKVDLTACVGDVIDGRGDPNRTIALLTDADVLTVRGNHDRWILSETLRELRGAHPLADLTDRSIAWISGLPATRTIDTPLGALLLCHGVGDNDMARLGPHDEGYALSVQHELDALVTAGDVSLVVGGHTHERMVRRFGGLVFINAGTLRDVDDPCCAILDTLASRVNFFDFDKADRLSSAISFPLDPNVFPEQ